MKDKIEIFSQSEILTLNALSKLNAFKGLNPSILKLINAVVYNVCEQLEQTEDFKKHNIKIN